MFDKIVWHSVDTSLVSVLYCTVLYLVSVLLSPVKVHYDGELEEAADVEEGSVELEDNLHDFNDDEDSPERHVSNYSPAEASEIAVNISLKFVLQQKSWNFSFWRIP